MSLLQSVDLHAVAPVLVLASTVVAVLVVDLISPRLAAPVAALGTLGSLGAAASLVGAGRRATFCLPAGHLPAVVGGTAVGRSCSYVVDPATLLVQVLVLGTLLVVLLLGVDRGIPPGEYHLLLLASATGMLTIAAARDLLTMVVSLELVSLPGYVLVGLRRRDPRSSEAALKFFVVSVLSSAVTLLGMALLYGLTGSLALDRIATQLQRPGIAGGPAAAASVLALAGFAFKVSAVPFHFWAPDAYQGAPVPVAAWLAVASKAAGLTALITLVLDGLRPERAALAPVLGVLAVLTMTVGNLVALQQRHLVRLLAWSSIAQAGYLLVPIAASFDPARVRPATYGYLAIYAVMNAGAFGCVALVGRASPRNDLEDYRGLAGRSPWLAVALAFFLLCLAGAPPGLAGLFAKVVVFRAAIDAGAGWLAVVMAVNTVIGLAVYLRVATPLFLPRAAGRPAAQALTTTVASRLALAATAAGAFALGVYPSLVLHPAVLTGH